MLNARNEELLMSPEEKLRKIYAELTDQTIVDKGTLQQMDRIRELAKPAPAGIDL